MSAKNRAVVSIITVVVWVCCLAFASVAQTPNPIVIRAQAYDTVANAVQEAASMFVEEHSGVMLVVSGGNPTQAFRDLLAKNVELVVSPRLLTHDEDASLSGAGIVPSKQIVGWDGIAVIANPKTSVLDITLDQARKIFSGEYTSWKDLGGPAQPIMVVIPPLTSEETVAFQELVLKGRAFSPDTKIVPYRKRFILREVAKNDGAIGLCSARLAYLGGPAIRILGLKEKEDSVAVLPSIHGGYGENYLLRQPIYMYWDSRSTLRGYLEEFIQSCLKYGLEIYR